MAASCCPRRSSIEPGAFTKSNAAPKVTGGKIKNLADWTLSELINVSQNIGVLGLDRRG